MIATVIETNGSNIQNTHKNCVAHANEISDEVFDTVKAIKLRIWPNLRKNSDYPKLMEKN
jgi:hypothetical protein